MCRPGHSNSVRQKGRVSTSLRRRPIEHGKFLHETVGCYVACSNNGNGAELRTPWKGHDSRTCSKLPSSCARLSSTSASAPQYVPVTRALSTMAMTCMLCNSSEHLHFWPACSTFNIFIVNISAVSSRNFIVILERHTADLGKIPLQRSAYTTLACCTLMVLVNVGTQTPIATTPSISQLSSRGTTGARRSTRSTASSAKELLPPAVARAQPWAITASKSWVTILLVLSRKVQHLQEQAFTGAFHGKYA